MGEKWKQWQILFSWDPKSLQTVTEATKLKDIAPWKKSSDKHSQYITKQRYHFAYKGPYSQSYGFSSSHVWMWEVVPKKADCQNIDAFERWSWRRLLRVHWTARSSNQSILREINPEYSLEGLMPKAEAPILWLPDVSSQLPGKHPDAGKIWGQEEKEVTEDKMVGWHHWLNGHKFERTQGCSEGQRNLACCSSWGRKEWEMT